MLIKKQKWRALILLVAVATLAAACAKRPASIDPTSRIAAPPPTAVPVSPPVPTAVSRTDTPAPDRPRVLPPTAAAPRGPLAPAAPPAPAITPFGAARPAPGDFAVVPELRDVFFDFDRYAIRPDAERTLAQNMAWMKSNPRAIILIEGHCDERGTSEYNLALGERRAQAARNYLVSRGVEADRITLVSYGKERPVCGEQTEECWALNRRAHFLAKQL